MQGFRCISPQLRSCKSIDTTHVCSDGGDERRCDESPIQAQGKLCDNQHGSATLHMPSLQRRSSGNVFTCLNLDVRVLLLRSFRTMYRTSMCSYVTRNVFFSPSKSIVTLGKPFEFQSVAAGTRNPHTWQLRSWYTMLATLMLPILPTAGVISKLLIWR